MKKLEQKFCTQLGKWWDNIGHKEFEYNINIEGKISTGTKPFNFKGGFKPHQLPTMIKYNIYPMHWKISDMDTISTKHYDMSCTKPEYVRGVIAIHWVRKGNKTFYLISPEVIQGLIDSGLKSLKEEVARDVCFLEGVLK